MLALTAWHVSAQDFPNRAITMVMPYAAGGPGDTITRLFAGAMQKHLGQQIVVDNTAGASGSIGTAKVARAKADGYTLLMIHVSHATNVAMYKSLPYHPVDDFEPIGRATSGPMVIVARNEFPAKNLNEFVAYVKANGSKVSLAHAGVGSASHLCGLMMMNALNVKLNEIPYKGTGPALNDLIGGQISALLVDMANAQNHVKSGKLRALAINGPKRSALLPDVPTFTELGFAGVEGTYARFGVLAPTGTPQAVIERISRDLTAVLTDPAIQDRFRPAGYDLYGSTPAQMGQMLRDDGERWGKVIAALGGLALD